MTQTTAPLEGFRENPGGAPPHTLQIQGHHVAYTLRRSNRRSVGLQIHPDRGLVVSAPRWASGRAIEAVIQAKGPWIVRKLGEMRQRQQRAAHAQVDWGPGAVFPFLGQPVRLEVAPGATHTHLQDRPAGRCLVLAMPAPAQREQVRDAVQAWLQSQALVHFKARVAFYAAELGVQPTAVLLSAARTRWGSATQNGRIRLNWRLMHLPPHTVDYVVAHEVAHLREMNHSPAFWGTVARLLPDWAEAARDLRQQVLPGIDP